MQYRIPAAMQYFDITERIREQVLLMQPLVEATFGISLGAVAVRSICEYEKHEGRRFMGDAVAAAGMQGIYGGWLVPEDVCSDTPGITLHELNHLVLHRLSGMQTLDDFFKGHRFVTLDGQSYRNLNEGFAEFMKFRIAEEHCLGVRAYDRYTEDVKAIERWERNRRVRKPITLAKRLVEYARSR